MMYKDIFTNIYENFGFGSTESRSGPGSTLSETEKLRKEIVTLVKEKGIKTVVDIPCGDFNWMKEVVNVFDTYTGGDIVEKAVEENTSKYGSHSITFLVHDLITDKIPYADLLIVRDVIGHLPLEDGLRVVGNILNSDCKYLLSTTWAKKENNRWNRCDRNTIDRENVGAEYGRFYPVNLMNYPFNLPEPDLYLEEDVYVGNFELGNRKVLGFWDLEKLRKSIGFPNTSSNTPTVLEKVKTYDNQLTVVSGLWDIGRDGRDFKEHYLPRFREFLKIPNNMVLFLPRELHSIVWEIRDTGNTFVREYELRDIKALYEPHWEVTQKVRNSKEWLNITGEGGWLKTSPQSTLEYYNPIVQSKMFMLHDASIWNPFNTEYFYWLDAGITNTVPVDHFTEHKIFNKLPELSDPFLFLAYPYEAVDEIHGFDIKAMNTYAGEKVKYVCRGGLFGGHKDQIGDANATYYSLLQKSLQQGYMGTEESIFTIMSYNQPELYRRYMLDGNGLIVKFTQAVIDNSVTLEQPSTSMKPNTKKYITSTKTNLYILTFNFPEQLKHTINSMKKVPEWLSKPNLVLLDNSTDLHAVELNKEIAKEYNFEYIWLEGNKGINGGRQAAAEHFDKSDADFMLFFEDDMTINSEEEIGNFCRNGFRKYIPDLYEKIHKIMIKEEFDFLKLSFTEVYWDNNIQTSWYNVPQSVRTEVWPNYNKLPISGIDPNAPRTKFERIDNVEELAYITGEVFYCNWPMIVSKAGNKKMFIDTKWDYPYEQTWMSFMFQETLKGNLKPGLLLASPIWHDRISHYPPEIRREN